MHKDFYKKSDVGSWLLVLADWVILGPQGVERATVGLHAFFVSWGRSIN